MKIDLQKPSPSFFPGQLIRIGPKPAGNVLLYVVVLMLIFGVLGVVMVSLFTSSTASTVTRNDTRRARYLSESGVRYAASELRAADFEEDIIIDPLNTLTYTVSGAGSFDPNIFGPWFDSAASVDSPDIISLSVPLGELPSDFTADPLTDVWLVNYDYVTGTGPDITTMRDRVISYSINGAILDADITGDFVANAGERVCLAVEPSEGRTINEGGDLFVVRDARLFFPPFNGAVNINRIDYAYERLVDDPANNRVILANLTASQFPNTLPAFPLTVEADIGGTYSGDFVILSPRNYMVMAEGTSDAVTWGDAYGQGLNVYDHSLIRPESRKPDITADDLTSNLSEQESDSRFFETDIVADTLTIGGGLSGQFGSAFYAGDKSIGGNRDYCEQGACLFGPGVRVFFLVNFSQQGDGITFTLLGKGEEAPVDPNNSASSVGGDFRLSELMGYAGDSRLDEAGTIFLATNEDDRGLDPPKIAVEFDTRTNSTAGDPPPDYCEDPLNVNVNQNTRNDPLTGNQDAVQYVFWGRENFLNIPCRGNSPLYDDNRHDAFGEGPIEEWRFDGPTGPISIWRPAIGPDGTIYASDQVNTLYAFDEDGTVKWTFNLTDGNKYMPGVDPVTGTIYSDIFGASLVAINPDGTEKWRFKIIPASDIDSTPTVGPDSVIYFGTNEAQALIALNPDGTEKWRFPTGGEVDTVAVLSPDGTTVYFVANDNNLYALKIAAREADPDGAAGINIALGEWTFPIDTDPGDINSSPTVNPDLSDGTIYVGSADDHSAFAINPDGTLKWQFNPGTGRDMRSSPTFAVDPIDGIPTVYIGSDDGNLYAIDANTGDQLWGFDTGSSVVSSPIVDVDGTIYVGSDNGNVYAVNPDGTEKWNFPTGDLVRSSPALGLSGFIHIGSDDTNLYTLSQYANPKNFKDADQNLGKLLTSAELDSTVVVDSTTNWLNGAGSRGSWAVRLEVNRSLVGIPNALGELQYDYQLRLWMRQCSDQNDIPCSEIMGTFFQDTRFEYDYTAVVDLPMVQEFKLSQTAHNLFDRFFLGFTGAAGAEALDATITNFQSSFIRPGDPVVDCDSDNWPVELSDIPPLENCTVTN